MWACLKNHPVHIHFFSVRFSRGKNRRYNPLPCHPRPRDVAHKTSSREEVEAASLRRLPLNPASALLVHSLSTMSPPLPPWESTWFAIRNQSFVTNKDKCYKRPRHSQYVSPLNHPSLFHPPSSSRLPRLPATLHHNPPPTTGSSPRTDIKRQIKIRCYLSKLRTGSDRRRRRC